MSEENESNVDQEALDKTEHDARTFGWVPLAEFRGGEEKWVDAETFVKRGKEINPILKKNNELLLKKLDEANRRVEEVGKVADEFRTFQKEQVEKRIKEYDTQIAALKAAKVEAVSQGDGERVVAIDDAIDVAKEEKAAAKAAPEPEPEPTKPGNAIDSVLQAWIDKNDWYGKDKRLTRNANDIAAEIRAENPSLVNQAFLDKLSEELEETFPDKFGKKPKPKSPVEGSSSVGRPGTRGGNTYENLPPDAKDACDRFCNTLKGYTRDKYLADYYAD